MQKVNFVAPNHSINIDENFPDILLFQSYKSIVARRDSSGYTVGIHWDYSATTMRQLFKHFIPENIAHNKKTMQEAIESGLVQYDEKLI